jgi:hypothetical protein
MPRLIPTAEYPTFFAGIAALDELQQESVNVRLTIHGSDVADEQVTVLAYLPNSSADFFSILVIEDENGQPLAARIEDVDDVVFTDFDEDEDDIQGEALTLDTIAEFPSDATISFSYTTARGSQKSITALTPAFVRPSERHAGKSILVGFAPQEDGTFTRKTFRTDRITNLVRDAA